MDAAGRSVASDLSAQQPAAILMHQQRHSNATAQVCSSVDTMDTFRMGMVGMED